MNYIKYVFFNLLPFSYLLSFEPYFLADLNTFHSSPEVKLLLEVLCCSFHISLIKIHKAYHFMKCVFSKSREWPRDEHTQIFYKNSVKLK